MARTANTKSTPQFAVWRVRAVAYGLLAGFVVLAGRGIYLQVVQHEDSDPSRRRPYHARPGFAGSSWPPA